MSFLGVCLFKELVQFKEKLNESVFLLQKNGHKEDILSIAQCPPNLLATAGYDGEIIVWNMVSGHIFCKCK